MGNSDSKVLESKEVVVIDEATLREQESATAMGSSIGGSSDRLPPVPAASSSSSSGLHQRRQPSGRGNRSTQEQDDVVRAGPASSTSCISDDRVDVNIAMSDLMAYLQVVANNSSGLPITRRDNPSMPSSTLPMDELNPDDYQRKSAAFVPADVRVIGATYTGYRTIWDLPRTQSFDAVENTHEPGRSYGGACSNALLKVLYDAANDNVDDLGQAEIATDALFEDEDDDLAAKDSGSMDEGTEGSCHRSLKSGFSLDATSQTTISWRDLLQKMDSEIKQIDHPQVAKLTTSRRIDLSQPFSLVPDTFDAASGSKKRSLLIGCNYGQLRGEELKASHDDVRSMKDYIVNVHGFPESKGLMTILMDDEEYEPPTFLNIVEAFKALSEESQPGDAVFVHFSGHGGRVFDAPTDASQTEGTSYDEVIAPWDYKSSGLIQDTLIFKTLLAPMRYGVTVTIIIDCCDTGMVLDMPYSWSSNRETNTSNSVAKLSANESFSFVRFLRVVKALYETSTFTRLGKSVGSAVPHIDPLLPPPVTDEDSAEMDVATNKYKHPESIIPSQNSILDAIAEACTPMNSRKKSRKFVDAQGGDSKREGAPQQEQSLLEQVWNCTLLSPPEEEFFYDEDNASFESAEDEKMHRRRNRRSSRSRIR